MENPDTVDQAIENAGKIADKHIKSVSEAVDNVHSSGTASLHASIKLGVALLEARKALGANFYEILKSVIHRKRMQRYIKMVAHSDCDDLLAKKPHLNDKNHLKVDTRVVALLEGEFSWEMPSMGKITSMRYLSDENFKKVMEGDYKPLEDSIKERDKLTPTGKEKIKLEEKFQKILDNPKDATDLVYEYSKTALLNELHDAAKQVKEMTEERNPLEEQIIQLQGELDEANAEIERLKSNQEVIDQTLRDTGVYKKRKRA